ncbi:MAG: FAD:protein FMN transferase [Oscillospiraceae bacterium]|jgi:thiamine biosynthesis lipoprotein|nr:FAD:protein FMN transferase [Oscillospiraceae bacterium]
MLHRSVKKTAVAAIFAFSALLFTACARTPGWTVSETFALDTIISVQTLGAAKTATDAAVSAASETESLVFQTGGNIPELLETAALVSEITDGALDLTLTPVLNAWGFGISGGEHRVPSDAELAELLASRGTSVLDVGSAAKGYALKLAGEKYLAVANTGSCAMLNFGGSFLVLGKKPDGSRVKLGLEDPKNTSGVVGSVKIENLSVTTSGDYQRYFESGGVRYHHILDPKTGKPANSGLSSVIVVCPDPLLGDCLSTALFVLGTDGAARIWREYGEQFAFELVLVTTGGDVFVTENLAKGWDSIGFGERGAYTSGRAAFFSDRSYSVVAGALQ